MATFLKSANFNDYNGSHFYIELYYSFTQNVSNNTSTVTYDLYAGSSGGWSGWGSASPCYINGVNVSSITGIGVNSRTLVGTRTETITHNADGTKTVNYSASINTNWSGVGSASLNGSITLPTIPRASSIVATDSYVESASTINITRAVESFTHTLSYSFDGLTGTIVTKTANTSYGWVIPTTFYDKLKTTSYTEGKDCTITCKTYNGNTLIGTTTTKIKISVNPNSANTKPVVSATITLDGTTNNLTGATNRVIRGVTDATIKMTATAKNGATISSKSVLCGDGKSLSADGVLYNIESASFVVSAIDSRDITNQKEYNLVLVEYVPLTINPTFYRTSPTNNVIALTFTGNYFNKNFGTATSTANTLTIKYRYKLSTATSWSSYTTLSKTLSGNTYSNGTSPITLGSSFDYTKEYNFEIVATDKIGSKTVTATVIQGLPVFDWGKSDFQFNVPVKQASGNVILDYTVVDTW